MTASNVTYFRRWKEAEYTQQMLIYYYSCNLEINISNYFHLFNTDLKFAVIIQRNNGVYQMNFELLFTNDIRFSRTD
jgi:hypothetical protein